MGVSYGSNQTTTKTFQRKISGPGEKDKKTCWCIYVKKISIKIKLLKTLIGQGESYDLTAGNSSVPIATVDNADKCPRCLDSYNPYVGVDLGELADEASEVWLPRKYPGI